MAKPGPKPNPEHPRKILMGVRLSPQTKRDVFRRAADYGMEGSTFVRTIIKSVLNNEIKLPEEFSREPTPTP